MRKLMYSLSVLLLVATPSGLAHDHVHTDTFSPGQNAGQWTLSGNPTINSIGGNPDHWLHNTFAATFAPIARSVVNAGSPFSGDFKELGVVRIAFDAILIDRNLGNPNGFEMSILLRNTNGSSDVDDHDYVYFVGPQVPLIGQGWHSYSFDIPSDADTLPPGWSGGWVGDPENLRPGVTWNDVISNVDQVEIWWLNPSFFALIADWNCGMDNISIEFAPPSEPCPGDANDDGVVNVLDLLMVISNWGSAGPEGDVNSDGVVNVLDLLEVISNWGSSCE